MSQILCNKAFEKDYFKKIGVSYLDYFINNDKLDELVLVVPTGKLVRRLQRKIVKLYFEKHKKPVLNLKIHNLSSLIRSIHSFLFINSSYIGIGDYYVNLIIEEILKDNDNEFYKISDNNSNSFLVEKVKNTIISFKENNITIANLETELNSDISNLLFDKRKLIEIIKIYKEYNNRVGLKLIDEVDYSIRVNKELNSTNSELILLKLFGENCKFVFDGFSEFKETNLNFLSILSKTNIPTSILFNYDLLRGPSFADYESAIVYLVRIGFVHKNNDELIFKNLNSPDNDLDANPNDFLRRWLFTKSKSNQKYSSLEKVLNVYTFKDKKNEVDSISKLIKYLTSYNYNIQFPINEKIELKDICICSRKPQEYSSLFRESLIRNKIPNDISDRFNLSESTIVTFIINFLEMYNKPTKLSTFIDLLKNEYFNVEGFDKTQINNLIDFLLKTKARRIDIKSNMLKKEIENIEKYIQKVSNILKNNEIKLNEFTENSSKVLFNLNTLSQTLPKFNKTLDVFEFKKGIIHIIQKLRIIESLKSLDYDKENFMKLSEFDRMFFDIEVEKNSRAINKFLSVLEEFTSITFISDDNQLVQYKFKDLISKLKDTIKSAKYQIKERLDFGVTVTSIEQTRGIPYKVMILCGAIDGIFPIPYLTDKFLGKELKSSEERHRLSEQLLFYQFLSNGVDSIENQKKIYITSYKFDGDKIQNKSYYTNELLRIVKPESEIDFNDINSNFPIWYDSITDSNEVKYLDNNINRFEKFEIGEPITTSTSRGTIVHLNDLIQKLNEKTYSVSKIKNHLKCAFVTLGNDYLNLRENDYDFDEEIQSNEKGNIIHSTMEKFYNTLIVEGKHTISNIKIQTFFNSNVVKLEQTKKENYLFLIQNLLKEVFQQYDKGSINSSILFHQLELVYDKNNEFNRLLSQDLIDCDDYATIFTEFKINNTNSFRDVQLGESKFTGKIDRIDIKISSLNDDKITLRLIDYKSKLSKFDFFQLNIYDLLIPDIFKQVYQIETKIENSNIRLYDDNKIPNILKDNSKANLSKELALESLKSIKEQNISIKPKQIKEINEFTHIQKLPINNYICTYCNLSSFCRIKEIG